MNLKTMSYLVCLASFAVPQAIEIDQSIVVYLIFRILCLCCMCFMFGKGSSGPLIEIELLINGPKAQIQVLVSINSVTNIICEIVKRNLTLSILL